MPTEEGVYLISAGGLISILLSIIAYFLKFMLQDFRTLQVGFQELNTKYQLMESAIKAMSQELNALRIQLQKNAPSV